MKRNLFITLLLLAVFSLQAKVKVSILGDSYSTFEGWIPDGYDKWYGPNRGNDVKKVEDTWWHQLIEDNGLELEINNSWSGATICNTGYNGEDYTIKSFLTRSENLGENPDLIFVFGGTNDDWAGVPLGTADGTDMFTFRPAVKAMLKNIKNKYPDALCMTIINTELKPDVVNALIECCETEEVPYIQLEYIDKQKGHPSINGMKAISKQVWKATAPLLYENQRGKSKK